MNVRTHICARMHHMRITWYHQYTCMYPLSRKYMYTSADDRVHAMPRTPRATRPSTPHVVTYAASSFTGCCCPGVMAVEMSHIGE